MPDVLSLQSVAYVITGAALSVPIMKYLVRNWLKQREEFERSITAQIAQHGISLAAAKEAFAASILAVRDEGKEARNVLRQHVDHEDGVLRERNHKLAGDIGILVNKVEVISNDVRIAVAANEKTLAWCQEKYGELVEEIHHLAVAVAKIAPKG